MAKTGILTDEQMKIVEIPYSRFTITGDNGSIIYLPRVYDSPLTAIYRGTVREAGKFNNQSFIVDKPNKTWTYEKYDAGTAKGDEETIITKPGDTVLTFNVDKFVTDNTETIATGTKGFATPTDATNEIDKLVDNTRKVNNKQLITDITLDLNDVGGVPKTRKVNGHELSADVTVSVDDVGGVPEGRKINGVAVNNTGKLLYLSSVKSLYQHNIRVQNSYYRWIRITIYNNSSTVIKSNDALATWLYNNGFRSTANIYPSTGFDGANGNRTGWQGLYATSTSVIKVHETPKKQWSDFKTLFPDTATWRDDVVNLM